jgi:hypothetical protein
MVCRDDPGVFGLPFHQRLVEKFESSVHRILECGACHGEFKGFPHTEKKVPVCSPCHSKVVAGYQKGVHGMSAARAVQEALGCGDCHGKIHSALPRTDPGSPVHRSNLAGTCARCHASVGLKTIPHSGRQAGIGLSRERPRSSGKKRPQRCHLFRLPRLP